MGMFPPLASAAFSVYTKDIGNSRDKVAENSFVEASNHLAT